jgi:hypothetical protein
VLSIKSGDLAGARNYLLRAIANDPGFSQAKELIRKIDF